MKVTLGLLDSILYVWSRSNGVDPGFTTGSHVRDGQLISSFAKYIDPAHIRNLMARTVSLCVQNSCYALTHDVGDGIRGHSPHLVKFTPATQSLSLLALPEEIGGNPNITYTAGRLFAFGLVMVEGKFVSNLVYAYDLAKDAWAFEPGFQIPRGLVGAAAIGNKIYIVGGYDASKKATGMLEEYTVRTP
jgi:hypothetical protein